MVENCKRVFLYADEFSFAMSGKKSVRWVFNFGSWSPTEAQLQLATSCIQEEEKMRIGRFVFRKDAKASLAGRLLMRKFVAENSSIAYNNIKFARDERGKPYLVNQSGGNLMFNVSHQGSFAVLAGELDCPELKLGIDVMKLEYSGGKSVAEFFRIMTRHFSPSEWVTVKGGIGTSEKQQIGMFCRHWCLKESYVKAIGTGITVNLQSISFHVRSPEIKLGEVITDTQLTLNGMHVKDWIFEESMLDQDHCVAVALGCKVDSNVTHFEHLKFEQLMEGCIPLNPPDIQYAQNFLMKSERP